VLLRKRAHGIVSVILSLIIFVVFLILVSLVLLPLLGRTVVEPRLALGRPCKQRIPANRRERN
jgi:hypothetical protein